jgi:hypothetical protein
MTEEAIVSGAEEEILEGKPTTSEGEFYIAWAQETQKRNMIYANEVLRSLMTLSATLLGGSIAFLQKELIEPRCRWFAIGFFMGALVLSMYGSLPYEGSVHPSMPKAIEKHKFNAYQFKATLILGAAILLFLGLLSAVLGLAFHGLQPGQ